MCLWWLFVDLLEGVCLVLVLITVWLAMKVSSRSDVGKMHAPTHSMYYIKSLGRHGNNSIQVSMVV